MKKTLSYSSLSTFLECRRKWYFKYVLEIEPKERVVALNFGAGIHGALDVWHVSRDVEAAVKKFHELYKEDLERCDKRTNAMGEWILRNYAKTYAYEPFKVVKSEHKFELELPSGVVFNGVIDKIVEWDGVAWIMDHKTTSSLGYQYGKRVDPSLQLTGYTYAARQLGYPKCAGVIVDAILVAKGLLQASSRARLTPLARFDGYISAERLQEWKDTVAGAQADIKECYVKDVWYPNWDRCASWGECEFRKLCREDGSVRDKLVAIDYQTIEPKEEEKDVDAA